MRGAALCQEGRLAGTLLCSMWWTVLPVLSHSTFSHSSLSLPTSMLLSLSGVKPGLQHACRRIHVGQVVCSEAARRQAMTSVFTGMAYASDMTATEHVPCEWRMPLWDVLMISERVFVVSLGALYPHNSICDI